MVTSRRDLKSFMIILIVLAVMSVVLLVIDILGIVDDFGTYAGFVILSAVIIILVRDLRARMKTYPRYSRFVAVIIAVLIIGLALAITSKWLMESVSPTGGSVAWYNDMRSDYQSVAYSGLLIGGIAAASGLFGMASRNRIEAWMDSRTSDLERIRE